jgi:hypothetical protein
MKLISKRFDVAGMSSARMLRQQLYSKLRPLWWFSNELAIRHILALLIRQYLGRPIAYLITRYERQWHKLLAAWRRIRPVPERSDG